MRILFWFIGFPLVILVAVVVMVFAANNAHNVSVNLWPFPYLFDDVQVPLFVIAFIPLLVGVLIGGIATWMKGIPKRHRIHRDLTQERDKTAFLEKQLDHARQKYARVLKESVKEDGIGASSGNSTEYSSPSF